ncbi:ROK family protein [Streptomyces aidingensis]|uniref:ROK family protein n=1 Tax=Streptomyces aidingensis TaxID=910347 RepID=UPI0015875F09|nr:ROK family protein [Streptomyces aidingensis]
MVAAIDAGKTKFLAGVFTPDANELERCRIRVTTPRETVDALLAYLDGICERYSVVAIGLAVFGPLEVNPGLGDFGGIVGSSEPQWSGVNLPSMLTTRFHVPVLFDFDVNAAAIAEARNMTLPAEDFVYLSIGTGIGGTFHGPPGRTVPRTDPPQLGHMHLPREPDDGYPGSCRFHGACFQGLASGRALSGRWQRPTHELPAGHRAWDLEARYIARACANLLYSCSFTTVRMGAGISQIPGLVARANHYLRLFMNGFPENLWRGIADRNVIEVARTAPHSSLLGAALQAIEGTGLVFPPDRPAPGPAPSRTSFRIPN